MRSLASRAAGLLLALPGCLVSFNDYPLGDVDASPDGSGGSKAEGGAPPDVSSGTAATLGEHVIDDFEDGNAELPTIEGRSGSWYSANDGAGMQMPPATIALEPSPLMPARATSGQGVHTVGGPFQTWGALIGTTLATQQGLRAAYDLSTFEGIRLWVRSGAMSPSSARSVRLNLPTRATLPGGGCSVCNDHFGAMIPLTSKWERIEVRFSDLIQTGFGVPRETAPDLASVMALELLMARGVSFDLWVDDIELF